MKKLNLKTKSGNSIILDLINFTYKEIVLNNLTIYLYDKLIDNSNEIYSVGRILNDSINLKDNHQHEYNFSNRNNH